MVQQQRLWQGIVHPHIKRTAAEMAAQIPASTLDIPPALMDRAAAKMPGKPMRMWHKTSESGW